MKTGPQRYPGASTAYWHGSRYPGSAMEVNVLCWHSTEGTSLPSYDGGSMAPNFTAVPDFTAKRLVWYQHFDFDVSSRALRNLSGGVETNTLNVCQVEIVGTCDPTTHAKWTRSGVHHLYMAELPDWAIRDLAAFAKWANTSHGVPLSSGLTFKAYPSSYGGNGVRMTGTQWNNFTGHCGHQHVPENDHGDPGAFPMAAILAAAKNGTTPPEEDDMPTAAEIADAVVAKLIAGGGVLENSDLDRFWGRDVIPAARPPYNNPDYFASDGKTVANDTWTAKYAVQTAVEYAREAVARLKNIESAVGTVDLSDADIAALASAVAANPALAEQIAEKVAVKLAERLAD
ncbi:hypothetical protein TUSST3_09660 [Streptomyces sp. TUS-ST3]|uniref:hypothetical protein n=1 Tax=Streptomyces sp. TUS-ST3 TaxID=3025591 RepID=UPI0024E09EEA|nr:hypothetical protein [Streptomyces sp. TUS-ST3]GLP64346.1 hypothetical protein TUSST3_09660 [Streptomyces sp. TUS-ST3]